MRIFLAGGTGAIGRHVLPGLVAAGHQVTVVARSAASAAAVRTAGARSTAISLFDREAVLVAVEGHEVVINLATHVPRSVGAMLLPRAWKENDRLRREASRHLADAALATGATRFIQESFAYTYPDGGDRWIDESVPLAPARHTRTVLDAERSAGHFAAGGSSAVVLRFAAFYDPASSFVSDLMTMVRKRRFPFLGDPEGFLSFIEIHDAGRAVLAALDAPAGTYNVVDDEPIRRRDLAVRLGEIAGVRPPALAPAWVSKLTGSLGETIARSIRMSNRKLREATPWRPAASSIVEGLAQRAAA